MSEIDSGEGSEASDEYNRPSQWNGAPRTWKKYTEHERGLSDSLDQIRNSDLSVHLYNAHALKQRAKEYEENPQMARVNTEYPGIPETDRTFKPPKYWTAWPLPPNDVPREGENVGLDDPYESYTLKRKQVPWPSRDLEDILMGVTLKGARKQFERRMSESENESGTRERDAEEEEPGPEHESVDGGRDGDLGDEHPEGHQTESTRDDDLPNEQLKPAISLDDEKLRELLRPSIRHTLSELDDVLMALHHARKTCRRYSQSDAATTDEEKPAESDSNDPEELKRPKGRPRKFADLPVRSRGRGPTLNGDKIDDRLLRTKKTHRGRPKKVYEQLEGETQQDYLVRIARLQKKPLPSFAPSQPEAKSRYPSNTRTSKSKSPRRRATSEELDISRQKKLGLRDWSEVLGAAALVGFSPEVVARATRRCANLFGQGMEMRSMVEKPFSEKEPDSLSRYVPEMIPDLDNMEPQANADDDLEASNVSVSEIDIKAKAKAKAKRATKTSGLVTCFCLIDGCPRKVQGFRDNLSLKRHLQKAHKIGPSEVDNYILPSDEELDGAVHVDNFLKPIHTRTKRQGARAKESPAKSDAETKGSSRKRMERRQTTSNTSESSDDWSPSE